MSTFRPQHLGGWLGDFGCQSCSFYRPESSPDSTHHKDEEGSLDVDGGAVAKVQGDDGELAVDHVADDAEVPDPVPPQTFEGALEWFGANAWIIQGSHVI